MPSPIIIDPISGEESGILRPLYRRPLMAQFGPFVVLTTTAASTHGEARRHVIVSSLRDDTLGRERLKGRYLYVASGAGDLNGHQTRIVDTGYYGAGGILELSAPFDTVLPAGAVVEISAGLPCEQFLDLKGGNQLVNEGLARCTIESWLSLTGNGTRSYSLLDYEEYLDQEDRIDAVYDSWGVVSGDPTERPYYPIRVDTTNATRTLVTGYSYSDGQTFNVRVLRAGHTLVNDGTGWHTTTTGLLSDTDAGVPPIPWVVAFGMVKALDAQQEALEYDETISDAVRARRLAQIMMRRRRWARTSNLIAMTQFPRPTPPLKDSMVGFGGDSSFPLTASS